MHIPRVTLIALLFVTLSLNGAFSNYVASWGFTGNALGWHSVLSAPGQHAAGMTALQKDFDNTLAQHNWKYFSDHFTVIDLFVNATGAFFTLRDNSFVWGLATIVSDTTLTNFNSFLQAATSVNASQYKAINFGSSTSFSESFLFPGVLPTPPPPGVLNSSTTNLTLMLSGLYTQWQTRLSSKDLIPAIENDVCAAVVHSGIRGNCTVNLLTPHTADTSKMLPGDGNSGLTVQMTVVQDITDDSYATYKTHAVCAVLMSANYTQTTRVYNGGSTGSLETVQSVAVYADIPYSVLNCEYVCIVSLSIMVSVVYLFLCTFIIAVIAVKVYLINDFSLRDMTMKDMNVFMM